MQAVAIFNGGPAYVIYELWVEPVSLPRNKIPY